MSSRKPQEPVRPFPYEEREVAFANPDDGTVLHGTLTVPSGADQHPAAVLVTGSGPQDRDEEILGHRPFLVLADWLTRRGFAVLRYDDRHFGMPAVQGWSFTTEVLAGDARAALDWLHGQDNIDTRFTGIIGHSEGGVIAPFVAARDRRVAFIVSLAGNGLSGHEIARRQWAAMALDERDEAFTRAAFDLLLRDMTGEDLRRELRTLSRRTHGWWNMAARRRLGRTLDLTVSAWNRFYLHHDPAADWCRVTCPALALFGEHDIQVEPEANRVAIERAVCDSGHADVTLRVVPSVNHLFQTVTGGGPKPYDALLREYADAEETISPVVLMLVSDWLLERWTRKC